MWRGADPTLKRRGWIGHLHLCWDPLVRDRLCSKVQLMLKHVSKQRVNLLLDEQEPVD